jgi:hypothetical protein
MADAALKQWVAEQLHGLIGFSNSAIAAYIVSQTKRHKSVDGGGSLHQAHTTPRHMAARPCPRPPTACPDPRPPRTGLIGALKDSGIDDSDTSRSFATELLARVPRQQAGPSQAQLQQRAAVAAVKRNRGYALLEGEGPGGAPGRLGAWAPGRVQGRPQWRAPLPVRQCWCAGAPERQAGQAARGAAPATHPSPVGLGPSADGAHALPLACCRGRGGGGAAGRAQHVGPASSGSSGSNSGGRHAPAGLSKDAGQVVVGGG